MREIKRYFAYMGRHRRLYWTILIITLIMESALEISYSYINKQTLNAVEFGNMKQFRLALLLCLAVIILKCAFPYLRYFQIKLVRTMVFEIKNRMFHKLMKLDMNYFVKNHSGEALKTLNWDANSLKDSWFSHVYWVLGKIVLGISSLLAMYLYSPILTVISVIFCGITVVVSVKLNSEIKKSAKAVQNSTTALANYFSDILQGFSVLKLFAGSSIVLSHFHEENETVYMQEKRRVEKAAGLEMISFLLGILGSFGTIAAGVFLCQRGKLDYGTVMAVVTLQMNISSAMQGMGSSMAVFQTSLVKAGRVFDFLELDCEEAGKKEAIPVDFAAEPVDIRGLTFSYGQEYIFSKTNMRVRHNEKIIIKGHSGCGKSTLFQLLMGFYPVDAGQIRIYGKDIAAYDLGQLRNMITYISQNNYLFEGTVAENIALGSNHSVPKMREEIVRAAQFAYADEFIRELPDGYDTLVGAGGSKLSGGQRQRIAIARAFLKDAPILLMDEPSSALDIESEQKINEAVRKLMADRVVIMVTHRETGTDGFDRVINL